MLINRKRIEGKNGMPALSKRVTVVSMDHWLEKLHGASILDLLNSFSALGHSVEILVVSDYPSKVNGKPFLVVPQESNTRFSILGHLYFLMQVTNHLLKSKPEVIIFDLSTIPCFLIKKVVSRTKGIMLILSRPLKGKGFKRWLRLLQFRIALIAGNLFIDVFTAISPFEAAQFSNMGNIPSTKIMVLPSPLGQAFISECSNRDINASRSKLKLNALLGKKILLYHGSLDERRGIMLVLELFAESCKRDDIILLIVGNGPAAGAVKEFIRKKSVSNIILTNPYPYSLMPSLIAACDIGLVLLPNNENWRYQTPTKLAEFLALHKPIIATNLEGIRWVVANSPLVVYLESLERATVLDFKVALERALELLERGSLENYSDIYRSLLDRFSSQSIAAQLNKVIKSLE